VSTLELTARTAHVVVDPEGGGRIRRLTVDGFDLLTDGGCFLMAPWAGRTGWGRFSWDGVEHQLAVPPEHAPHAIHGTVRDRPWVVESAGRRELTLTTGLGDDWPWRGWCEQLLTLDPAGLTLQLAVHSASDAFPAVAGWHPWFTKPDHLSVVAAKLLQRSDDHLPTGVRLAPPLPERLGPLDDCFEDIKWPATLRWDDAGGPLDGPGGLELSITATGCDHVVVFTEPDDATCVEPQTGPPNGLATGEVTVVRPGNPLLASTRWSWHRLPSDG
jgi:galactose mutarotase-like enzyme